MRYKQKPMSINTRTSITLHISNGELYFSFVNAVRMTNISIEWTLGKLLLRAWDSRVRKIIHRSFNSKLGSACVLFAECMTLTMCFMDSKFIHFHHYTAIQRVRSSFILCRLLVSFDLILFVGFVFFLSFTWDKIEAECRGQMESSDCSPCVLSSLIKYANRSTFNIFGLNKQYRKHY